MPQGIEEVERIHILKEVANTLIVQAGEERSDCILFTIADLINSIGVANTPENEDRRRYAQYNLLAGKIALAIPDFASALSFLKAGIAFLGEECWNDGSNYRLSLDLFNNAALAGWALGETHLMKNGLDEVMNNARCFEDKIDSMSVLIHWQVMTGVSNEMSLANILQVLAHLGETFPDAIDDCAVAEELDAVKQLLPATLNDLPAMKDTRLIKAMVSPWSDFDARGNIMLSAVSQLGCVFGLPRKYAATKEFFSLAIYTCYRMKERLFVLVSCRVVRCTLTHGFHATSSVGLAGMALSCE